MYIASLELQGFKSFGKRTSINFGEGITGIVGPNGCGKTNIVDAIRWVLGEQKQSILRSSRMDEVIFHGSKSHKPTNFSEVTLIIHNNKATLPLEYSDVEISRRIYRDGESEFLINRNPCRLKDIMDLFLDTGMGTDAYSVIELSMIETILSDVADDRRRMFEEAAGINKYKKQRRSAYRKLEATYQDLERVKDIIGEVEGQVKALRLQLKRFERYKRISADLKERELALARLGIQDLANEMAPLAQALEAGRDSHQAEAALIARDEKQLEQLKSESEKQEQELEAARQSLSKVTSELNDLKEKQLVWGEQRRSTKESLQRFEQEHETEIERSKGHKAEIARLEKELQKLSPTLEQMQRAFDARRAEEETVIAEYQRGEVQFNNVRERKFNHRHLIQEEEARRQRTGEMIDEKQQALEQLKNTIAERTKSSSELEEKRGDLRQSLKEVETRIGQLSLEREQTASQLKELGGVELRLEQEYQQLVTRLSVLQSRLEMISELVETHEGYPSGAREILADQSRFPGLLGAVADLVEVKPIHTQAVGIALGPFATCLVTETVEQARQLLDYAAEQGMGSLSVIPLERVRPFEDNTTAAENFAGTPLTNLVKIPDNLRGLYQRLLGNYYWTEKESVSDGDIPDGITVITSAGHLAGAVPFLTYPGSRQQQPTGVVGRSSEQRQLQEALTKAEREADGLKVKLDEVRTQRSQIERQQHEQKDKEDAILAELNQGNQELSQLEYEILRLTDDLGTLKAQIPVLNESIRVLKGNLVSHDKVIEHLGEQESQLEEAIKQAETLFKQVQSKRDAWQAELQELRVKLLTVENQRETLAGQKLSREDALEASNQRIEQLKTDCTQAKKIIADLADQLSESEGLREKLEEALSDQTEASAKIETAARESRRQISQIENQIRQRQHGRETSLSEQRELEVKLSDMKKEEELIRSRIREVYQEEINATEGQREQEDTETLQAGIEKLRASLERIGPINMAVADEYTEESKRLDFLIEQRDDLLQAEESLDETIRKIDSQARNQYRDTYDKVRYHFKQTFRLFFEGGEGDLRMVGDPDPLEADIEIIAQPPGKKTRSLRSLSGGEKALTAIALLFAIYMVKPSPFCILDEVDAPLDDVNIGKFTRVIKQFAKDTQFIVVTHNKLTMQSADYLYGVTMAEQGLSSLVSVDLGSYA